MFKFDDPPVLEYLKQVLSFYCLIMLNRESFYEVFKNITSKNAIRTEKQLMLEIGWEIHPNSQSHNGQDSLFKTAENDTNWEKTSV